MTRTPLAGPTTSNLRPAALGFLLLGLSTAPIASQAVPSDAHFRGFEPNADFVAVVAGKEDPKAEIFLSSSARSFLLISSELPSPVLVNAPAGTVETVDLMKVARQVDGSVDLLADAALASAGKFKIEGEEIEFSANGKSVRFKQKPWALGKKSGAELLASNPSYRFIARGFNPDAGIVKRLKAQKEPVRVLTFFGSWCPHCKRHLPLLMRVEEALAGSKFQFEYYGLPSPFGDDAEAKKHGVVSVPTAILFVGGQEIGRIPSSQWSNPEVAIDLQLNGPGRSKSR
jgi:thiol-disulfide isomerase/thioredoxin